MIDYVKWVVIEKKDWVCIGDINRSVGIFQCLYSLYGIKDGLLIIYLLNLF